MLTQTTSRDFTNQNRCTVRTSGEGRRTGTEKTGKRRNQEWAAPIVPVLKADRWMRICGDYRLTTNQAGQQDNYPLPQIEDMLASLSGRVMFSKLDSSKRISTSGLRCAVHEVYSDQYAFGIVCIH